MAKDKSKNIDKSGKSLEKSFSKVGNLIDELNKSLEKTLTLTQGVADNMSQNNDLSQKSISERTKRKNSFKSRRVKKRRTDPIIKWIKNR